MKAFQYERDPVCVVSCALYALNRWGLKPRLHSPFLHDHFNDLLLIPCALPLLLRMHRWLGLRTHDLPPEPAEIALYCCLWSVLFEVIGPRLVTWSVGDPWDAVAYAIGGIVSGCWWNRHWVARRELQ